MEKEWPAPVCNNTVVAIGPVLHLQSLLSCKLECYLTGSSSVRLRTQNGRQ